MNIEYISNMAKEVVWMFEQNPGHDLGFLRVRDEDFTQVYVDEVVAQATACLNRTCTWEEVSAEELAADSYDVGTDRVLRFHIDRPTTLIDLYKEETK
jgi:hypothetical protein